MPLLLHGLQRGRCHVALTAAHSLELRVPPPMPPPLAKVESHLVPTLASTPAPAPTAAPAPTPKRMQLTRIQRSPSAALAQDRPATREPSAFPCFYLK
eukprot:6195609-Pleurochrysis_carterae.AAC.4